MRKRQMLQSLLILSLLVQNFIGLGQAFARISYLFDSVNSTEMVAADHSSRHWCDASLGEEGPNLVEVFDLSESDSELEDETDVDDSLVRHIDVASQVFELEYVCLLRLYSLKEMKLVNKTPVTNHIVVRC